MNLNVPLISSPSMQSGYQSQDAPIIKSPQNTKISAYARLDFASFTFYIQTLQVVLGRKINNDQSHSVDVHLGPKKAVSRKHAKIFYNFGTQRFEISVLGRNGLFIDDNFIEKGLTVPLNDGNKIQIGQIGFTFVLPGGEDRKLVSEDKIDSSAVSDVPVPPIDASADSAAAPGSSAGSASGSASTQAQIQTPAVHSMPSAVSGASVPPPARMSAQIGDAQLADTNSSNSTASAAASGTATAANTPGPLSNTTLAQEHQPVSVLEPISVDTGVVGAGMQTTNHLGASSGSTPPGSAAAASYKANNAITQLMQSGKFPQLTDAQRAQFLAAGAGSGFTATTMPAADKSAQRTMVKKEKKQNKTPKKVYTLDEIPEQFRTKPAASYSTIITHCLRTYSVENKGMSLSEIYKAIQELYPYYKYCADGWQSSVRHNLSLNKAFKKISKEGKGWLWGLEEDVYEKEVKKPKLGSLASGPVSGMGVGATGVSDTSNNSINRGTQPQASAQSQAQIQGKLSQDNQKILGILQVQLRKITKNIRGLSKEEVIKLLTIALSSTMAQLQKNSMGKPLTKYVEQNPQDLTKILTNSLNNATTQVTKGKMTFSELIGGASAAAKQSSSAPASTPAKQQPRDPKPVSDTVANVKEEPNKLQGDLLGSSAQKPISIPLIPLNNKAKPKGQSTENEKKSQSLPPVTTSSELRDLAGNKKPRTASFIAFENNLNKLLETDVKPVKKRTESLIAFEQKLDKFLAGDEGEFFQGGLTKISENGSSGNAMDESAIDDD